MKRFEITLTMNSKDGKSIVQFDRVQSDSFVELLAQFQLVIAGVHREIVDEIRRERVISDADDIPF